ncbi:dihydrodipicolinate reductase C-terminal domain-containing protein [Streptomyces sp. NPDC056528]|uniref:dihydrodipicolinate reductase C-terminal domain-containing protein n=1 Tax=Streptomyces sp. NPDC056528 TaxID=3345854 RepID=UPI00369B4BE6
MPDGLDEGGLRLGVVGRGRLGGALLDICRAEGLAVVLTADRGSGWKSSAVPDVMVDASSPDAHHDVLAYCTARRVPLVACVSNLTSSQWAALTELSRAVPVVRATNLSFAHHLQLSLAEFLAGLVTGAAEPASTTVRERHPVGKAHRPSATAVTLAETWAKASGRQPDDIADERAGLPVSEHELTHSWDGESLHIRHHVGSWSVPARGALAAAKWARSARPGLVTMRNVYDELTARSTP